MTRGVLNPDILTLLWYGQTLMHPDGTVETRRFVGDGTSIGLEFSEPLMRLEAIKAAEDGPTNRKARRAAAAKHRDRRPKKKARY